MVGIVCLKNVAYLIRNFVRVYDSDRLGDDGTNLAKAPARDMLMQHCNFTVRP